MRNQQSQRDGGASRLTCRTRARAPECVETCVKRPLVENARVAGAAKNAKWPVTCDSAGSIAVGRSSQP